MLYGMHCKGGEPQMKCLPSYVRDPICIAYRGEIKMIYTEFNEYNANESLRVRRVRSELKSDGITKMFFVTIEKERYDVTELVKRDVPYYYNREVVG